MPWVTLWSPALDHLHEKKFFSAAAFLVVAQCTTALTRQ